MSARTAVVLLHALVWLPHSGPGAPRTAAGQDRPLPVDSLIQRARSTGLQYLSSGDDRAKKAARRDLEDAEKGLKSALKRDENCEPCYEHLTTVYFLRTYFGFSKDYEDCVKTAEEGLRRFPRNGRMAYTKASAHYNSKEPGDAVRALVRYLVTNPEDQQAKDLLAESQKQFLGGWYRQADFYASKEARIERYAQGSTQLETVFQVTPEWELGLGAQAATQLTKAGPKLPDAETQAYLEGLLARLTAPTKGPTWSYQVTVLNSPAVNAVTVPGHVFVHTGLLRFVETESELAGVLSHELAHNYGHHAARRFIKNNQAQMLAALVTGAVSPQSQLTQLATQIVAQAGIGLFMLAYSRSEEREADLYGTHLMFNAGYNPTALSNFFLKLYKSREKQQIKFLSTHPPDPDRATYLTDYLESFPLDRELQVDSKAFQLMKARFGTAESSAGRGVLPPP